ncbi:hypothetical protein Fcan01_25339 [Folsomia candida]|uniref:Uncharacterized protein n=1 Tax=Folsomia candida TaxID=158441 RepID=A0A226D6E9_FOLCA|nr:hypothetical protein Fcan01_25339 [Folsomia candida]
MSQVFMCVLTSLVFLTGGSCCKNGYQIRFTKNILDGIENCDVHILHDTTSSDRFGFLENSFLPTTVILMPSNHKTGNAPKLENLIIDIFKSRQAPDKLSILIWTLMFRTEETIRTDVHLDFTGWLELSTRRHYAFRCTKCGQIKFKGDYWNFIRTTKNVFPIITTSMGFEEALNSFKVNDGNVENFIVLILLQKLETRAAQLCVRRSGYRITRSDRYTCRSEGGANILKAYLEVAVSPEIWFGDYFSLHPIESHLAFNNKFIPHPSINPFTPGFSVFIPLYIAVSIVSRTNASLRLDNMRGTYARLGIEAEMDGIPYGRLNEFTHHSGLQFLSCYSESYITFDFYLMPFKPQLWIAFIISMAITFLVLYFYMRRQHKRSPYSVWLSFISVLLDDSSSVPDVVGNSLFYRLVFVTWAPALLLFTNCYSGLMITELNAPLKQKRSQSFEGLICHNRHMLDLPAPSGNSTNWAETMQFENYKEYWGKMNPISDPIPRSRNPFASANCYKLLSSSFRTPTLQHGKLVQVGTYTWHHLLLSHFKFNSGFSHLIDRKIIRPNFLKNNLLYLLLMNPIHDTIPAEMDLRRRNYSVIELQAMAERDAINCRRKSAFIATSESIRGEMSFLSKNYPSKEFHTGQHLVASNWYGWWFQGGGRSSKSSSVSAVQRNFQGLVHSGIYSRLKIEKARNMWLWRKPVENDTIHRPVAPLEMDGGIVTIFMLSGALISIALVAFMIESHRYEWKKLVISSSARFLKVFRRKAKLPMVLALILKPIFAEKLIGRPLNA